MDLKHIPVLDHSKVQELLDLERQSQTPLLSELIEIYEKIAPERIIKMTKALAQRDWLSIKSEAHAFKASTGNLGFSRAFTLCREIEKQASASDYAKTETLLIEINREMFYALDALKEFLMRLNRKSA
ncbi:MAG: Hpt domain-containing protein [Bdellovibrionales bacterium]